MNSWSPKLFCWLVSMALSACSVSAPLNGELQVPVHLPDRVTDYHVSHYANYSGGKMIEVGYLLELRGDITNSIFNISLLFNAGEPKPRGEQDLMCTSLYRKGTKAGALNIPLICSSGQSGVAQVTITSEQNYSGYGTLHLSDGSSGNFGFGTLPPPPCGCVLPPPAPSASILAQ